MSTQISLEQIKALRDKTGISIMQCRKALEDAGGDEEKALILLRKKGAEISAKKGDREMAAGIVSSYIHSNGLIGSMVELGCETDFVAKNEEFLQLAHDIAMQISATNPEFRTMDEIAESDKTKAREIFAEEVVGKPEELKEKILQGKLDSYFKERVLLDQPFIKNQDLTIRELIDGYVQKFGERIEVSKFSRFAVGR
ncbi:MAG: elongation factor Ts [bacterium]